MFKEDSIGQTHFFGDFCDEEHGKMCPKYQAEILPDENGMCSLCGLHTA